MRIIIFVFRNKSDYRRSILSLSHSAVFFFDSKSAAMDFTSLNPERSPLELLLSGASPSPWFIGFPISTEGEGAMEVFKEFEADF